MGEGTWLWRSAAGAVFAASLAGQPASAAASGFSLMGEQDRLVGDIVLGAGNISQVGLPDLTDPRSFCKPKLYSIGQDCFETSDDLDGHAALLVMDKARSAFIADLGVEVADVMVRLHPVLLRRCSTAYKGVATQGEALKRRLELQLKQIQELRQQLIQQQRAMGSPTH